MSFSSVIHKVTPWIATAASIVAPGAAPLIGIAAKCLSNGLGAEVKPTTDSIASAITTAMASPDQLAKLKQIDDDFAVQMKALGFQGVDELLQIDAADRANARAMQVSNKSWVVPALAVTFVIGFFIIVALKMFHVITAADQMVNDLIDTLRDALMLILSYYFGSSAGSAAKNDIIASQAQPK